MSIVYVRALIFVSLVAISSTAGCGVRSVHPLSDPDDAVIDEQLLGVWRSRLPDGESGTEVFLHIGRLDHRAPSETGRLRCVAVFHNKHGRVAPASSASLFTTQIGERKIANVQWRAAPVEARYTFAKYDFVEDQLQIFPMRTKPVMNAINKYGLQGDVARVFFMRSVLLTDNDDELFNLVARACDDELFGKTTSFVFDRITR